ncbi:hypothetical protein AtubIFM61612_009088 [Aspergillus tubingensis]|nr:hypothetical protein AtubIFM61612_009088 [Aspergillus tubingensis]
MNGCPAAPLCRYSYIQYTQKALKQPYRSISRTSTHLYNATPTSRTSSQTDWNTHDEFFKFTRGRFLINEAENLRMREIQFDMNSLARIAAESVGATHCTSIQKYPDGMFNKAFLMLMDNGREVVAKVPNPNAGIPYLTTASEVATMDFARNVLETPVPRVYTWNTHAQSHPVGAEFIIMEKAAGVPLSHVWETLKLPQKLQVLLAMLRLQKKWLSVSFSHYGSLYYAKDIQASPPEDTHYIKNGKAIKDSQFAIGPTTGRDWCDASRSLLNIDRGPCTSYIRIPPICEQSLTRSPNLSGLTPQERAAAVREYTTQNLFIGWRKLTRAKNPALYRAIEFRKTPAYGLIFLAHRMFEYGEAHFMSLLVDMKDHWGDLPDTGNVPLPFEFTEAEIERIKVACDGAVAGTELVDGVKEQLGDLWPDKGLIENEWYEECRAALGEVRDRIVEELGESEEEREEYRRWWPFD